MDAIEIVKNIICLFRLDWLMLALCGPNHIRKELKLNWPYKKRYCIDNTETSAHPHMRREWIYRSRGHFPPINLFSKWRLFRRFKNAKEDKNTI
jgi:hypothetical protein